MFSAIGRWIKALSYLLTGQIDAARRTLDTNPHVIRAKYDAIVIGAGSVGCPIAYFLTHEGMKVLVVDREHSAGQGQNKAAIGGVRATHSEPSSALAERPTKSAYLKTPIAARLAPTPAASSAKRAREPRGRRACKREVQRDRRYQQQEKARLPPGVEQQ